MSRNNFLFLIIGVLIGYIVSQQFGKRNEISSVISSVEPKAELQIQSAASTEKPIKLHEAGVTQPKMELTTGKKEVREPTSFNSENVNKAIEPKIIKERELVLNDFTISKMERSWTHLPQQIKMNRESRGWRVLYLKQDSLFSEAGFRQGDLITDDAIYSLQSQNSESNGLATRVIRILSHVQ